MWGALVWCGSRVLSERVFSGLFGAEGTALSLGERIPACETRLPRPEPLPVPPAPAASWSPPQPWLKNNPRLNCS